MSDTTTNQDPTPDTSVLEIGTNLIGANWQEQDATLRNLWMQNKTPQQIGDVLGRSVPAIMTRAARLGLPRRSAPGRKPGVGAKPVSSFEKTVETKSFNNRTASVKTSADAQKDYKPELTLRICLMCLRKFESAGRHNRICLPCKGSAEYGRASALPDVLLP